MLRSKKYEQDRVYTLEMLEAHREKIRIEIEQKRKQEEIEAIMNAVPMRFQHKAFSDFKLDYKEQLKVKNIIEMYANSFKDRLLEGTNLIFLGKPGTGKTLLTFVLYQTLVRSGFRLAYQPSLQFLRLLHEKQFESHASFELQLKNYQSLDLLMIDEVTEGCGKGACPADWERNLLRMVIDARYAANRPTLVISNRGKNELLERLGEPTLDRLSEKGISLAFNWKSYRN